jgi:ribokinase
MLCQLEVPQETTLAALQQARKAGVVTILTPAPAPPAPLDAEFYLNTDILVPNKGEALALAGMSATAGDITTDTLKTAAQNLLERGCRAVVMTLGSKGCFIAIQSEGFLTHVPAAHVTHVVDTTGAGDAFSGALAYFYAQLLPTGTTGIHGASLIEAARRAAFVAAESVTKKGTQKSYPSRSELPRDLFTKDVTTVALPVPARV